MTELPRLLLVVLVAIAFFALFMAGRKRKQDSEAEPPESGVHTRTRDMDVPSPGGVSRDADDVEAQEARAERAAAGPGDGPPYMLDTAVLATALSGGGITRGGAPVTFAARDIGRLEISSGQVAASDPLVEPNPPGYTQAVPNGTHPVRILIARFGGDGDSGGGENNGTASGGDQRIAYAQLRFTENEPVRWEMAHVSGSDPATLKHDEFFGYGVDAGIGCFMDPRTGALLEARMAAQDDYFEEIIDDMEKTYEHTRSWLDFRPDANSSANVICFSSGYGDGSYPTFFGFDAQGNVAVLVTDFMIVGGE